VTPVWQFILLNGPLPASGWNQYKSSLYHKVPEYRDQDPDLKIFTVIVAFALVIYSHSRTYEIRVNCLLLHIRNQPFRFTTCFCITIMYGICFVSMKHTPYLPIFP